MANKISFISNHTFNDFLDCYPIPASSAIPNWYKECPVLVDSSLSKPRTKCCIFSKNSSSTNTTFKNCTPFLDGISSGYILRLPIDVQFRYTDKGFIDFGFRIPAIASDEDLSPYELITTHHEGQHPGLPNLNINNNLKPLVFKFNLNFSIKTPTGYSTFYTHPINRYDLPFMVYSGVVDTDRYNIPVQFPFQITYNFKHEEDILIIPRGTPICQVIPFKREEWKSNVERYNKSKDKKNRLLYFSKIVNAYKSRYWSKKKYD
jgi:hypothetical protein